MVLRAGGREWGGAVLQGWVLLTTLPKAGTKDPQSTVRKQPLTAKTLERTPVFKSQSCFLTTCLWPSHFLTLVSSSVRWKEIGLVVLSPAKLSFLSSLKLINNKTDEDNAGRYYLVHSLSVMYLCWSLMSSSLKSPHSSFYQKTPKQFLNYQVWYNKKLTRRSTSLPLPPYLSYFSERHDGLCLEWGRSFISKSSS